MRLLPSLVAAIALSMPALAQDDGDGLQLASTAPIYKVSYSGPILMAHHTDGAVTGILLESITNGVPQLSLYSGEGRGVADIQTTNGDVPVLETCWTDIHGARQCVRTPVASTSEGGMKRAIATHQALVAAMQKLFPPAIPE